MVSNPRLVTRGYLTDTSAFESQIENVMHCYQYAFSHEQGALNAAQQPG